MISDPVFVKTVLNTNSSHFDKDRDPVITAVIGHGLLLANGEPWKRQRKIMVLTALPPQIVIAVN